MKMQPVVGRVRLVFFMPEFREGRKRLSDSIYAISHFP